MNRPAIGSGVFTFDQPSAVAYGSVAHVVFIGYATGYPDSSDSSGRSVAGNPRSGWTGRVPGAAVPVFPAVLLLLRKAARKALARR